MHKLIEQLLFGSGIFHIKSEVLDLQLKSHPEVSSVKAISDTLDYFNVKNLVANVPKDALLQLPSCFLAIIEKEEISELVLVKVRKGKITTTTTEKQITKMSSDAFNSLWNGTIIAVESEEKGKKPTLISKYKTKMLLGVVIAFLGILQILDFNPIVTIYQVLSLIGLYISTLIISEELGMHNAKVAKLCNSISNKSSCNDVITSRKNSFLKVISLSDASITFFSTLLVVNALVGYNHTVLFLIASVSMIIVLFSIYYQAFSVKKWCVLCLGISTVLLMQFTLLGITFFFSTISLAYIIKSLAVAITIVATWAYIKPFIVNTKKLETIRADFLTFKRNRNVFNFLLSQKKIDNDTYIPIDNQIIFGNPKADIVIKAVSNPLCGFCVEPFKVYDAILNRYSDSVQIHFIFNVSENEENLGNQISRRIIELYFKENKDKAYTALKQWFANRDIETWQEQFGVNTSMINEEIITTISRHAQWCMMNEVHYTPATILQENFFPMDYQIEDLLLFIDEMIIENTNQLLQPNN